MGTKKAKAQYRQGDVLIEERKAPSEKELTGVKQEGGRVILAHGEATGHAHALPGPTALLFEQPTSRRRWLRIVKPTELLHEEHHRPEVGKVIALGKGDFEVIRQVEYSEEDVRQVAD